MDPVPRGLERQLLIINGRGLFEESMAGVVAAQSEERSIEQVQRDIYDSHRHRIFSLAFHMTGNELAAEQLLTDCFVRAFEVTPKPDSTVIDSALIAGLRLHFSLTPAAPASITASSEMNGRNVLRTDLEEAIQELPPIERLAFLLRDVEGYSTEAISKLMDVSQPEVTRVLFSARIRLRGILADMETERAA
jgi:RNA polymerase sigma-70 factor (ECF subfamily)